MPKPLNLDEIRESLALERYPEDYEWWCHCYAEPLIAEVERLRARLTSVIQINDALLQDVADMRASKRAVFTEPFVVAPPGIQAMMREMAQDEADAMERLSRAVENTAPTWDALKRKMDE